VSNTWSPGAPGRCVICGAALAPGQPPTVVVCTSPACQFRARWLPAHQKCRVCQRPLSVKQWPEGVCADRACRERLIVKGALAAKQVNLDALVLKATKRRHRAAAKRGIPSEAQASYRLSIVPRNDDRMSRLPARRRRGFEEHLRSNLAAARSRRDAGEVPPPPSTEIAAPGDPSWLPQQRAELALLGAGCAACRGYCCRTGGEHAYNTSDTMLRYICDYPDQSDDEIVDRYLGFMEDRTFTHGCVYQRDTGCTLPRELRSDTCNGFYCSGLRMIRNQFASGDPVRAYFVLERAGRLVGGTFVEVPVASS
jgi:hypothetical protein